MSNEFFKRFISSIILLPLAFYFILQGSFLLIFFTVICFVVACFEWHMMAKKKSYYIYGFLFLIFSFYAFYKLSTELIGVIYIIIICSSTDIGGYVFGKIFKGPKLTKFSPNKTYAGMIGGYLLSIVSAIILTNFYLNIEFPIHWFIFAILISTISQLGDIIISYFKRLSKIKDTGKIIPGHGGLMDRFDCQMIMALFTWVHYNTFIKITTVSVAKMLYMYKLLKVQDREEFLRRIVAVDEDI